MNAPVKIQAGAIGSIKDFTEACRGVRWYFDEGWITKQIAVDGLQFLAEHGGYEAEHGVDQAQRWMSDAFAPMPDLPNNYVSSLVRDWEMDDSRDRWRWTGEPRPVQPTEMKKKPAAYAPADSTIDAFGFVLRLGDPAHLVAWLASHPLDAPHLMKLYEAKHVVA
ncbi:hypothetical protein ACVWZR_007765 [Bradyrhizobium sp. i1.3.1]